MRREGGQTLVEVLLALGIAVIIITAIISVVIIALSNASFSKNQNLANAFAQEGLEVVRAIRDRSWTDFDDLRRSNCLEQNSRTLVERQGANCAGEGDISVGGTQFIREVIVNRRDRQCRPPPPRPRIENHRVTVAVRWSDGRCRACTIGRNCPTGNTFCHQSSLISCLGQQSTVPIP